MSIISSLPPSIIIAGMAVAAPFYSVNAGDLPAPGVPQSIGVQLKGHNNATEDLDAVKSYGISTVRRGFLWQSVEKEKGVYDFTEYDRQVKDFRERGMTVIGCIALQNKLYGHVKDAPAREAYARYAAALVERYKGEDIIWELWNEPNVRTFWGWHGKHNSEQYAAEYLALVKAAVPAMRAADPDCRIMAGAVSGLWEAPHVWMEHCFRMGILETGIDAWSVHPYSLKSPEDYLASYERMRGNMVKHGGDGTIPVVNSERGYPLGKKEGYAGGDPKLSREYQAWHCIRQYLIDQLAGVRMTIWYEWSGKESFSMHDPENPTPAATATKFLLRHFAGCSLQGRVELASDRDFALLFSKPDGALHLVAWTSPPAGETADKVVPHSVTIPVDATGTLVTHDLYGVAGTVDVVDGAITLALTGAPQYVTLATTPDAAPESATEAE